LGHADRRAGRRIRDCPGGAAKLVAAWCRGGCRCARRCRGGTAGRGRRRAPGAGAGALSPGARARRRGGWMSAPTLIGLLLAFAAVSFVVAPLLWPGAFGIGVSTIPAMPSDDDEDAALEALRDDLYAQIVGLDFEQAVGKTDEEEYRQERAA